MEPEKKIEEKVETPIPNEEPSQSKKERTRLEKLRHTQASIAAQIAEEEARNGIVSIEDDDDKPITKGDLKRIERETAKRTALQLTDDLPDDERSQVRDILETRILSTGNAQRDFYTALDLFNSEKNRQLAEEAARKRKVTVSRSSGTGAPAREEDQFVPTELELNAAAMVGKKTPAEVKAFILKARAKEQK
jgi:hypothetical protein